MVQGVTTFASVLPNEIVTENDVSVRIVAPPKDTSIQDTLIRPVLISSYSWGTASTATTINPLKLWQAATLIHAKLSNYYGLKGKLCLKFVHNGSPYTYGSLIAYVALMPGVTRYASNSNLQPNPTYIIRTTTQMLQLQHVLINPSCTQTYEMKVPFCLNTAAYQMAGDILSNYDNYINLTLQPFNPLLNVNGVASPLVNVQIYAWMEDSEVLIPTLDSLQSGNEKIPDNIYRRASTAFSGLTSTLSTIPILAPYVSVAQAVNSIGDSIATLFGFSKPTMLPTMLPILNNYVGSMSLTIGNDPSVKLTADPNQGVAVSASSIGVGTDSDMLFSNIVSRWGYIGTITWPTTATTSTVLLSQNVSPATLVHTQPVLSGVSDVYSTTPCSAIANCFRHWSGTVKFRFEIISTIYHRGTIRVLHFPDGYTSSSSDRGQFVKNINVDTAGSQVFDVEVPYSSLRPCLETTTFTTDQTSLNFFGFNNGSYFADYFNGTVTLEVTTPLSSNGTTDPIYINVYHAGGEDLNFLVPYFTGVTSLPMGISSDIQSSVATYSLDNGSLFDQKHIPSILTGEKIGSVGQLIKRFSYGGSVLTSSTGTYGYRVLSLDLPDLPSCSTLAPATLFAPGCQNTSLISYFSSMFLARRGGVRHKYDFFTYTFPVLGDFASVLTSLDLDTVKSSDTDFPTTDPTVYFRNARLMANAGNVDDLRQHPLVEVEVPYRYNTSFVWAQKNTPLLNNNVTNLLVQVVSTYLRYTTVITDFPELHFGWFVAAADDYTLNHFYCSPVFYHT